uniref:14 kDa phosphohistidine phosphatase n=1 Tax=Gopherus evgoodei TaxID=1825980 RepID=A0A8C4W5D7_9SAUR
LGSCPPLCWAPRAGWACGHSAQRRQVAPLARTPGFHAWLRLNLSWDPFPPLPCLCVPVCNVGRVTGSWQAAGSADIYEKTAAEIKKQGYDCECLGGGRISHQSKEKKIHVYGYSVGFGRAKHSVSTKILKDKYPDYAVTWADEGY